MRTREKCVVYFRLCTGVLIKMSNERVIRAAPQRLQTRAYLYTDTSCLHANTELIKKKTIKWFVKKVTCFLNFEH